MRSLDLGAVWRPCGQTGDMTTSVTVRAPLRVLDAGGWTDTWFAGEGKVCHLAVDEGVEVTATHWEGDSSTSADTVELNLPAFGHRYVFGRHQPPGHHPLLEAALLRCSSDCALRVVVRSLAPAGSGLGTSGSAVVALIAALCALAGDELEPATLARTAHEIETLAVGLESGVQDQIAAAHGGANGLSGSTSPLE